MSQSLGTLDIVANTKTIFNAPNSGVQAILIGNESGLTVTVTMENGGVNKTLYPGTIDWFSVRSGFTGNIIVNPVVILNNSSTFPASTLIFDAIGLNDSEQASMYPLALPSRNTNIGNPVSTVSGGSNFVQNDANVAGTSIVEATVSGDSASAVSLTNDAIFALGDATHPGSLTAKGPITASGASVGLAVTNNATVGGTLAVTGAVTANNASNSIKASSVPATGVTAGNLPVGVILQSNITGSQVSSAVANATTAATATGVTLTNNTNLNWLDHLGTARGVMSLDSSDIVQIFLTAAGDRLVLRDSTGAETYLDLQSSAIILGDGTTKLPVTIHGNVNLTDGTLTVSGISTMTGAVTFNGAGNGIVVTNNALISGNEVITGSFSTDGANITTNGAGQLNLANGILDLRGSQILNYTGTNVHIANPGAANLSFDINSSTIGTVDSTGITGSNLISNGSITLGTGQLKVTDGNIKHFNGASTACGNGTSISHGLSTTPRMVHGMPGITQPGSATSGVGTIGATTFTATIGAGTLLLWTAWHE